jgi:hypothetical protein
MKIILTLVLSIFLINVNLVNAAGFDCSKASTNVEKIICSNEPLEEVVQTKNGVEAQVATTITMTDATEETVPVKQTDLTQIKEKPLSTANQIPQQSAESVLGTQEASITRPFTARYAHVLSGLIILLVFFSGLSFPVLMRKVF